MPRSLLSTGRRFLIWVVAGATSIETLLQAAVAGLRGERDEVIVWMFGALLVFFAAIIVEKIKALPEA